MTPGVAPELLRTLFLFADLSDVQLAWLCTRTQECAFGEGETVFREGQAADHLFVLLDGGVRRLRRSGRDDVLLSETSRRGVFAGAVRPFIGPAGQTYDSTLVTTTRTRFVRLSAADFTEFVRTHLPMAVHLVGGTFGAVRDNEATLREREYVARLGALSAGLAHELNNPASAVVRASWQLQQSMADGLGDLRSLAAAGMSPSRLEAVLALPDHAAKEDGAWTSGPRVAVDGVPDEEVLRELLDRWDVRASDELMDVFGSAGVDPAWLQSSADALAASERGQVVQWLGSVLEARQLLSEIQDAAGRISRLVDAVKQFAYLDSGQVQDIDVHVGIDSVLTVLSAKLDGTRIVREYTRAPRIPAYPAELNHAWTNLVDNAADALAGGGTLSIRTTLEERHLRVDICDDGPGVPPAVLEHVFEPFLSTKGTGAGRGLGLHVAWRIVEQRHHGRIDLTSDSRGTCVTICLPLQQDLV